MTDRLARDLIRTATQRQAVIDRITPLLVNLPLHVLEGMEKMLRVRLGGGATRPTSPGRPGHGLLLPPGMERKG